MLRIVVIQAGLAAFSILFFGKIGLLEKIEVFGHRLLSEAVRCSFCLSFWFNLKIAVLYCIAVSSIDPILAVPLCTVITRKLL